MNIVITKNNHEIVTYMYVEDPEAEYEVYTVDDIPLLPQEDPGFGKKWMLAWDEDHLVWERRDRELTDREKAQAYDDAVNGLNILGVE